MALRLLFLAPLAAACLHILEEFLLPGGFAPWFRAYVPGDTGITTRRLVAVNAVLVYLCLCIPLNGPTPMGLALWLTLVGTQVANAVFHLRAALRTRRYVPGCATSLVLYLPLAAWGIPRLVRAGLATPGTAASQVLLGVGIMLFIDHRYRFMRALAPEASRTRLRSTLAFAGRAGGWALLFTGLLNPILVPAVTWMRLRAESVSHLGNALSALLLLASVLLAARRSVWPAWRHNG
jgi:hypothetical protein